MSGLPLLKSPLDSFDWVVDCRRERIGVDMPSDSNSSTRPD
jgi:hypothetical protein